MGFAVTMTILAGCGSSDEAAAENGHPAGDRSGMAAKGGARDSTGSGRGGGPGGGMGAPGRGPTSVVLGPNDVIEVKTGPIEAAMAIQGDLRPIEEVTVRARVEGNIDTALVREGDAVKRGQLLARFESGNQESARRSAQADLESAKADVSTAQWNADQSAELYKAGAIPERDLRTAQQSLVAAQARQAAAEAKLRSATQDFEDTRVLSPTTGVVSQRSVENGEHVARGTTVFTVVRNDVLELTASLPARYAEEVRPSQPVRFNAAGRELNGRVARVNPNIDPANRSVAVYLQVPNADGTLRGNTFATGRIISRTVSDAITVPTAAVRYQQTQSKPFVYRIVEETIEYAPIEVGITDEVNGIVQVVSGLTVGDQIVVGNIGALGRGVKVTIARAPETGGARGRPVPEMGHGERTGRGAGGDHPVPRPPE
jgi:RND family efflux transporter MFP subunit